MNLPTNLNTKIYNQGRTAYETGEEEYDNPYAYNTDNYLSWKRGWEDAYADAYADEFEE